MTSGSARSPNSRLTTKSGSGPSAVKSRCGPSSRCCQPVASRRIAVGITVVSKRTGRLPKEFANRRLVDAESGGEVDRYLCEDRRVLKHGAQARGEFLLHWTVLIGPPIVGRAGQEPPDVGAAGVSGQPVEQRVGRLHPQDSRV